MSLIRELQGMTFDKLDTTAAESIRWATERRRTLARGMREMRNLFRQAREEGHAKPGLTNRDANETVRNVFARQLGNVPEKPSAKNLYAESLRLARFAATPIPSGLYCGEDDHAYEKREASAHLACVNLLAAIKAEARGPERDRYAPLTITVE